MRRYLLAGLLAALPGAVRAADPAPDPAALRLEAEAEEHINGWLKPGGKPQDHDKAAEVYSELIRRYPKTARYHARRGFCRLKRNRYPEALADLSRAVELDPKRAEFYGEPWGRAQLWCKGLGLDKRGRCKPEAREKELSDLAAALRLEPGSWSRHVDLAERTRTLRGCAKALPLFEKALALMQRDAAPEEADEIAGKVEECRRAVGPKRG